jgi:hypothetical protein
MTSEIFVGHRSGAVMPLEHVVPTALQETHLRRGLHAFGYHREAQVVGHGMMP